MSTLNNVLITCLLLLFSVWISTSQHTMDYSDIEAIDASCHPRDTCNRPRRLPFANRSCECDSKCHQFNDCCIDAPPNPSRYNTNTNVDTECSLVEFSWGVYMVSKCPLNYQSDTEIRSKCEIYQNISDPLASGPATDISSNITYKNRYCAHCNNAQPHNLRSWSREIKCYGNITNHTEIDSTYIENHLTFVSSDSSSWGFYYPEESSNLYGERRFYACDIPFKVPNPIRRNVRLCRPDLISTCAANWTRSTVFTKCQSYTAVVYIKSGSYKNSHCLMCNYIEVKDRMCSLPSGIHGKGKKAALSFTLLMDVNMSDGKRVGEVQDNRCATNQQWDPFAKRCRDLICAIPGYRIKNGACVRP